MRLPEELSRAIEQKVAQTDRGNVARAAAQLTEQYKAGRYSSPVIATEAHRAAYLAVRLPATFAVTFHVFSEIQRRAPEAAITSMLDLGAGPGTAAYAAAQVFPSLAEITLVEADAALIEAGKRLSSQSSQAAIRNACWSAHDLNSGLAFRAHDLVVMSYALGELAPKTMEKLLNQAWALAKEFVVIIEPGTMRGFGIVNQARSAWIAAGAHIVAPCPHESECPMVAAGDWCHFAERVERSSLHRQLKGGTLGHEDEKFSYVAAGGRQFNKAAARIVRHPQKHSGHVQLTLCAPGGLVKRTVTRSQKESYKWARKAKWGDEWGD